MQQQRKLRAHAKLADDVQTLCSAGCGEAALERSSLCAIKNEQT